MPIPQVFLMPISCIKRGEYNRVHTTETRPNANMSNWLSVQRTVFKFNVDIPLLPEEEGQKRFLLVLDCPLSQNASLGTAIQRKLSCL